MIEFILGSKSHLKNTALSLGVRLLLESRADDIITDVREILHDTAVNPFRTSERTTRILSGEEEGAFQWITVNYLHGYFDRPGKLH